MNSLRVACNVARSYLRSQTLAHEQLEEGQNLRASRLAATRRFKMIQHHADICMQLLCASNGGGRESGDSCGCRRAQECLCIELVDELGQRQRHVERARLLPRRHGLLLRPVRIEDGAARCQSVRRRGDSGRDADGVVVDLAEARPQRLELGLRRQPLCLQLRHLLLQ